MVDYVVDPKILIYDYDAVLSTSIQLIDAYPISMNEVNLSWSDNNQLMRITVSFAYRHWRITNADMEDNSTKSPGVPGLKIPQRGIGVGEIDQEDPFIKKIIAAKNKE